jgi:hypothetical protein
MAKQLVSTVLCRWRRNDRAVRTAITPVTHGFRLEEAIHDQNEAKSPEATASSNGADCVF